jgi:hypothetical protein
MDDHLILDTDTPGQDTDASPAGVGCRPGTAGSLQGASLSGLLDTLERLKGEFEQRLTGIVRPEGALPEGVGGPVEASTLDLLRPFADAWQSMGRAQDDDQARADAEPVRRALRKKRFLTDGVDVALGAFQGPVELRAYLASNRPDQPDQPE